METKKLEKNIKDIFDNGKYIVPLYQRNYAWRKNEIEQLLQDIYEAYSKNRDGYYFIGSLVVLKRQNGDFEVIDGQQRLTTLSLITKILGINKYPCLFYDSRPEVEDFFKVFYKDGDLNLIDHPHTFHLKNAIDYIYETNLDTNSASTININNLDDKRKEDFVSFFSNNVILVRVEIPEDTDVASYFEIMNNRGVQLQKQEILKSLLIAKLDNEEDQNEFAQIWNACSQMDVPIQRLFKGTEKKKKYFGDNFDSVKLPFGNTEKSQINDIIGREFFCIDDILAGKTNNNAQKENNDNTDDNEEDCFDYKSIIDFPNFLMHIFKLKYQKEQFDIPLHEKYLLSVYDKINNNINPKDFINTLFYFRVVFDRFILKTIADKSDEDEIKWALQKPTKNEKGWSYVHTFGETSDQERIIKALSMLQVTFRAKTYKTWLYDILQWFSDGNHTVDNIEAKKYISKLDDIILQYYEKNKINKEPLTEEESISSENTYSMGTDTPHFIFNFIDYLYWVDNKNKGKYEIKKFDFKYWNSVEHHMAREWAERNNINNRENFIDCLGNLCLISKVSNSRLNDRDVKEKVQTFGNGNLGAKRQIMYSMTKDGDDKYTWTEQKIKLHYNDVITIIKNRELILGKQAK